jgi:hypothetical protein
MDRRTDDITISVEPIFKKCALTKQILEFVLLRFTFIASPRHQNPLQFQVVPIAKKTSEFLFNYSLESFSRNYRYCSLPLGMGI